MRGVAAMLAVVLIPSIAAAQHRWTIDASVTGLAEAWDFNETREQLLGVALAVDRRVWGGLAIRVEQSIVFVEQSPADAWLRGTTLSARLRRDAGGLRAYGELGAGWSSSTTSLPVRGTRFNYLLIGGAGVEQPLGKWHLNTGVRWLHVSNNGREGRHRNPDIQSLGLVLGLGRRWR